MSHLDRNILITNISNLMANNGITQKQLGDILGMSQPNVKHALNPNEKKCFTLDQIMGIAEYFHVSIDSLVGNKAVEEEMISPRSIGRLLSTLIERHEVKYKIITKEEEVYTPEPLPEPPYMTCDVTKEQVRHVMLTIPCYWKVPSKPTCEEDYVDIQCAQQGGNEYRLKSVNDFLLKFIQIFEVYDNKDLDEEAYRSVVENYLSRLRDN